jgi:hypothetical protein
MIGRQIRPLNAMLKEAKKQKKRTVRQERRIRRLNRNMAERKLLTFIKEMKNYDKDCRTLDKIASVDSQSPYYLKALAYQAYANTVLHQNYDPTLLQPEAASLVKEMNSLIEKYSHDKNYRKHQGILAKITRVALIIGTVGLAHVFSRRSSNLPSIALQTYTNEILSKKNNPTKVVDIVGGNDMGGFVTSLEKGMNVIPGQITINDKNVGDKTMFTFTVALVGRDTTYGAFRSINKVYVVGPVENKPVQA